MTGGVAVVGSANLDIVVTAERRPDAGETVLGMAYGEAVGGKGANQAIAAARVTDAAFIGKVGTDAAGELISRELASRGVDVSRLEHAEGPSGRAFITVTPDGENSITVVPLSNLAVDAAFVTASLDAIRPEVVLTQCELPAPAVVAAAEWCRLRGIRFILNPSPVPELPAGVFAVADPLIVNAGEAGAILALSAKATVTDTSAAAPMTGPATAPSAGADPRELAQSLLTVARSAVLTSGPHGAFVAEGGAVTHIPGEAVTAVDTTGAGDEFAGVLAARLALGDSLTAAARAANRSAARIVALPRDAR